jgi:gamma-glutamylcyclotransferase
MLYFAYGSNMNWQQMQERCPSARFMTVATLPGHKLAFTRKSPKRGCGVADAVPRPSQKLWGVVYELAALDVGELDKCEGYTPGRNKNSYSRRECVVLLNDDGQQPLTVSTYFGDPQPNPPLPNMDYKNLILSGARHWRLPEAYIRLLDDQIEVSR